MGLRWNKFMEIARRENGAHHHPAGAEEERGRLLSDPRGMLRRAEDLLRGKMRAEARQILIELKSRDDVDEDIIRRACGLLEEIGDYNEAYHGYRL
ncbi:MAG: hypothetical protein ACQERI_09950, partial [Candidatus Krumholzibacteriota bacterium]